MCILFNIISILTQTKLYKWESCIAANTKSATRSFQTKVCSTKNLITDDKGKVIASDGKNKFLSELNEPYIHKIIAKSDTSGYIKDLTKFATCNITKDVLQPQGTTEMIDISEDEILFIVNMDTVQ